jgi:NDP-sugar pyrophosphorylase family protein
MAAVGEKPFLEILVRHLRGAGISDIVFCTGYQHEQIQHFFGDGRNFGVRINYSLEQALLGTGGALKNAERYLEGPFLVFNGDSFLEIDLGNFMLFHEEKRSTKAGYLGAVALTAVADVRSFGAVALDSGGAIERFSEKPDEGASGLVSAGVYLLEPEVLGLISSGRAVSLEKETFPLALKSGFTLLGYREEGFFADIGTPSGLARFQDYARQRQL